MIVEGSFNTELFTRFIEDLLQRMQPFPAPNSVIIMDNCAIHKAPEIRELIESRYDMIFLVLFCAPPKITMLQGHEAGVPTRVLARFQPNRARVLVAETQTASQPSSCGARFCRAGILVHTNPFYLCVGLSCIFSSVWVPLRVAIGISSYNKFDIICIS